jgi:hypothetical protein
MKLKIKVIFKGLIVQNISMECKTEISYLAFLYETLFSVARFKMGHEEHLNGSDARSCLIAS